MSAVDVIGRASHALRNAGLPYEELVEASAALQRASQAWQQLKTAEAEIYRLGKYRQLSRTMREDRLRHAQAAGDARKVLDEVLRISR